VEEDEDGEEADVEADGPAVDGFAVTAPEGGEVADAGWPAGEAEASTSETARNPRPTAAAAAAVQAEPRRRVRFMPQTFSPARSRAR
jgi:hypothetical protein